MGFCGCSLRATRIFAAIFSLIQGSAWLGLAIAGLGLYNCSITPDLNDSFYVGTDIGSIVKFFSDILYMSYFYSVECEVSPPNITVTNTTGYNVTLLWDTTTQGQVFRTNGWMITYIVLSALWIASSIVLIIIAVGNKKGKCIALWHYPWIVVMAAITIADVVATITYFLDMKNMENVEELFGFMGLQNVSAYEEYIPDTTSVLTEIPAVVMGVIFARFFVLWIINFALLIYVIIAAKDVNKKERKPKVWQNAEPVQNGGSSRLTDNQPLPATNEPQRHAYVHSQTPSTNLQRQESHNYHPRPLSPNYPQRQESLNYPQHSQSPSYHHNQESPNYPQRSQPPSYHHNQEDFNYQNGQRPFSYTQPGQHFVYPVKSVAQPPTQFQHQQQPQKNQHPPVKNHEQSIQNQQMGSVNPAFESDVPNRRFTPPPPTAPKPAYSSAVDPIIRPSIIREESLDKRKRAPTELRSQLPWSYYQPRDDPVNVKQQNNKRQNGEDLPPIPVPDYTLHFPRKPRADNPLQVTPRNSSVTKYNNDVLY